MKFTRESVSKLYVASTGRAGSQAVALNLDAHPDVACRHESIPELIRLSTELAYGATSEASVAVTLTELLKNHDRFPGSSIFRRWRAGATRVLGESDQKLGNLIPLVHRIEPHAKFVWLVRDGRKCVASMHAQRWFSSIEQEVADPLGTDRGQVWIYYRLRGDLCGAMSAAAWGELSDFERCCWYWAYWNQTIKGGLARVEPSQSFFLRLETLASEIPALLDFIGVRPIELQIKRHNEARDWGGLWSYFVDPVPYEQWSPYERAAFERICGPLMDEIYPDWR